MDIYDLIMQAKKGDFEAGKKLYEWAYLWPRLEQEFAPAVGDAKDGSSRPNPMRAGNYELISILAMVSLSPQPEPPDLPAVTKVAISAMKDFRRRILVLADQLETEIATLATD